MKKQTVKQSTNNTRFPKRNFLNCLKEYFDYLLHLEWLLSFNYRNEWNSLPHLMMLLQSVSMIIMVLVAGTTSALYSFDNNRNVKQTQIGKLEISNYFWAHRGWESFLTLRMNSSFNTLESWSFRFFKLRDGRNWFFMKSSEETNCKVPTKFFQFKVQQFEVVLLTVSMRIDE